MVLPSPRRSPRNHPSPSPRPSPTRNPAPNNNRTIGSTVRNVTIDFPTPSRKVYCDIDNCKGTDAEPDMVCILCEAGVHGSCFHASVRKLREYPENCHNEVFCSEVCCLWHGNEKIIVEDVRKERSEMQKQLKKTLVDLARVAKVKITQRIEKKSVQVSKATIIRRLVASKFNTLVGAPNPAAELPKVIKTIHCRFRLLNCIFSDELAALADISEDVDRAALDSGLVGDNSIFWKLVEERFNNGYPVGSIDGPLWADKVHFHHPLIANYTPQVRPADHGTFSSTDLRSMWKELQKEYDRVFMNFKKSGNHNSSFTKAAMAVFRKETGDDNDGSNDSFDSADADDCFGQEEDGFCCFTNSIIIVYLRLWLNERPGLTNFVSRHLPAELQIDSMTGAAALLLTLQSKSLKRKSSDDALSLAAAISELASAKKKMMGKKTCITAYLPLWHRRRLK